MFYPEGKEQSLPAILTYSLTVGPVPGSGTRSSGATLLLLYRVLLLVIFLSMLLLGGYDTSTMTAHYDRMALSAIQ